MFFPRRLYCSRPPQPLDAAGDAAMLHGLPLKVTGVLLRLAGALGWQFSLGTFFAEEAAPSPAPQDHTFLQRKCASSDRSIQGLKAPSLRLQTAVQAGPEALGWPGSPWGWTSLPCRAASQEPPQSASPGARPRPTPPRLGAGVGLLQGARTLRGEGGQQRPTLPRAPGHMRGTVFACKTSIWSLPVPCPRSSRGVSPSPPASNPWAPAGAWDVPSALTSRDQPCRMVRPPHTHTHVRPQSQGSVVTWASDRPSVDQSVRDPLLRFS